jgi:hypothetical protein
LRAGAEGEEIPLRRTLRCGTLSGVSESEVTPVTASPDITAGSTWRSRLGGTALEVSDRQPDGRFGVRYPAATATGILSAATITQLYELDARAA